MERVNKVEVATEKIETKETVFNFPELANLKEGMVELVGKLKENIDKRGYDVLVSDDVGGRIPTLILRQVIKDRNPKAKLNTYFVASGKLYFPKHDSEDYKKLVKYVENLTQENSNALLVTQYSHSGDTIAKLARALKDARIGHVDVAVMEGLNTALGRDLYIENADHVYFSTVYGPHIKLDERSNWLTGIAKTKKYDPQPHLLSEVMAREGRGAFISQEEFENLFGVHERDTVKEINIKMNDPAGNERYKARVKEQMSEDELKKLRDTINKAREDIKTLSKEILKEVWS